MDISSSRKRLERRGMLVGERAGDGIEGLDERPGVMVSELEDTAGDGER